LVERERGGSTKVSKKEKEKKEGIETEEKFNI
jgi:hypothetical protein